MPRRASFAHRAKRPWARLRKWAAAVRRGAHRLRSRLGAGQRIGKVFGIEGGQIVDLLAHANGMDGQA